MAVSWYRIHAEHKLIIIIMNKVFEDLLAQELSEVIEIRWDNHPVTFSETLEIDNELFVQIRGTVNYLSEYEEETNYHHMVWMDVDIEYMEVTQYEDGEPIPPIHINEKFVKKYLEQYLMSA